VAGLNRSILAALNKQHWAAMLWILRAAVLVAGCSAAALLGDALAVADYLIIFGMLGRPGAVLEIALRPVLAGVVMVLALAALPLPPGLPFVASAVAKVAVGGAVYGAALFGIWWGMGRPTGPENALLNRLPARFSRRLLRRSVPA
jgi:hypothetical protein